MEGNSWRPTVAAQGEPTAVDAASEDWRSQLHPEARQRIVNKIMDTLKRHLPISVPEGLSELKKIAVHFEEKIYTAAPNQSDYLRIISAKMFSIETKIQGTAAINPPPSNPAGGNPNPADSAQGEPTAVDAASVDWRSQLHPEDRQRIVNKIMDTLKRHLPISVPEGLSELKKLAVRFEEKIYTEASNQSDYLRIISSNMFSIETKIQGAAAINLPSSNPAVGNPNPADSASLGLQQGAIGSVQQGSLGSLQSALSASQQTNINTLAAWLMG